MRLPIASLVAGVSLLAPLAATADPLPPRKPGLWESKTTTPGASIIAKQCIDAQTDQLAQDAVGGGAGMPAACSKKTVTKTAAGYETEAICKFGAMTSEGKGVITGDFDSKIRMEITTTMNGVPGQTKPITVQSVIENRWIGPCEPGQKPGDIIMGNGRIVKTPGAPR